MPNDDRKNALGDAKAAMHAYAKNPTEGNAEKVKSALRAAHDQKVQQLAQISSRSSASPDDGT